MPIPFRVRLAAGRVGREVRLRVTISAHFPGRASSGAVEFRQLPAAPEMQGRDIGSDQGHEHETENRDRLWAGGCDRNGIVPAVVYVVYSGG
jgi:hypothetical protein